MFSSFHSEDEVAEFLMNENEANSGSAATRKKTYAFARYLDFLKPVLELRRLASIPSIPPSLYPLNLPHFHFTSMYPTYVFAPNDTMINIKKVRLQQESWEEEDETVPGAPAKKGGSSRQQPWTHSQ